MSRTDSASRVIAADASTLYRAFLDRDALQTWLPPKGMRAEFHSFDASGYRMSMRYETPPAKGGKSSEDADVVRVKFVDLLPGVRVVHSITFESDDPAFGGEMTMTWSLVPKGDGRTEVRFTAENVPVGITKEDHDAGLNASLENLAKYVE